MRRDNQGFTLIEMIMIIVIMGILAAIAIPKFIDFRNQALRARAEGNLASLRSAASMYYVRTATSQYEHLCTAQGNSYRHTTVPSPCYPANYEELESLLSQPPVWEGNGGFCYDSKTGQVTPCQ